MAEIQVERGLPTNVEAERMVLGAILLDTEAHYPKAAGILEPDDFSLEKHRKIFRRMGDLAGDGGHIDRVTVANALMERGELEACDGLSYLVSLDDGLPQIPNIESYCWIVREKAARRRIIFASQHMMNRAMADEESSQEIITGAEQTLTSLRVQSLGARFQSPRDIVQPYGGAAGFLDHAIEPGISTGYPQIDDLILGLQRGCQYVIAGRTGSGKSSLAVNMMVSLAKRGIPVAMLSLEMPKEILLARMICSEAQVSLKYYLKRELMADQRAAVQHALADIIDLPIYIDDTPGATVSDIPSRLRPIIREKQARVWFLDHIHRVNWQGDQHLKLRSEYDGVTAASWVCCLLARETGTSSVVCCQLNRPGDKKKEAERPTLSSLRSSGALEQDATAVGFVYREEMFFRDRPELRGKAELIVDKSRNGETGTAFLRFRGAWMTFYDEGKPVEAQPAGWESDD